MTEPNNGVTTSIFQTCCGFTTGTKNALGHGSVTNRDSQGRSVHSATLEDFVSHTNLLDPLNSKTLSETTTKYRDDGRVKFQTVWKVALGAVDRNNPPIAGVNGIAVADGLTTQYVYDSVITDNVGLDSTAGLTIGRLGGTAAAVSIQAAIAKLAGTIANGGAGTTFGKTKGTSGQATVVIAPDEKTMQVSITDGTGRGVMNATMTGPAATTPNTLINWTCTLADQIDTTTTSIAALKTSSIDPAGKQTSAITDGFGRTVASIDQLGNITKQSYDSGGNLLKSTDALTRETNFVYDGLGRQTTVTAPLSNVRTTVYSPTNGLVTSRTDAKGVSTSYGYDLLSRVLTTTDRTGKLTTNTYNTAGQLASITDAQAKVTTYVYNLLGQRTSTTLPDNTAKAMTYDPAGRLKKTTSASGKSQTNVYEFSGVLDKIEFRNAVNTLVGTDDYTYDALLRKTGSTGRYSVTQAWVYNDLGQLATDTTTYSGQSYAVNFAYDTRRVWLNFRLGEFDA